MDDKRIEIEAWFSGKVQGVGFRYETLKIARGYEVTGFVENLADGRVHLLAQGNRSEAGAFLAAVEESLSDFIRDMERSERPPEKALVEFKIRR